MLSRWFLLFAAVWTGTAATGLAQTSSAAITPADTGATAAHDAPENAWLTAGLGVGTGGIAAAASFHVSQGRFLGGVFANTSGFIDESLNAEGAVLGIRTSQSHVFATAAIGAARAQRSLGSDDVALSGQTPQGALVLESTMHFTGNYVGISANATAVIGPSHVSSVNITIGLDLGSFRRPPTTP